MLLTHEQAADIRARADKLSAWMKANKLGSYKPEELPAGINPPTNDEISSLEVFDFHMNKPVRYFLYIAEGKPFNGPGNVPPLNRGHEWKATTWTGEFLGHVHHGKPWRDNFGGTRVPITVVGVNGCTYHGTYYKSAGSYARVKLAKPRKVRPC
jgi:hypothetical protein